MNAADFRALEDLMKSGGYAELRARLATVDRAELERAWAQFKPMEKLVLFKLMDAPAAYQFYSGLSFREKYYLLCGFPLNSIAPVLEAAGPEQKRLFVQLPREFYDRMFRQLVSERVVMRVPIRQN